MADVRRLSFERAVSATLVAAVRISPDGRWVAYVAAPASQEGEHLVSAIWLVAADGGAPRRLTTSEAADRAPRWAPDGRRIAFVSDRQRRGTAQLYVLDLAGGEAARLTDAAGGVGEVAWSPGGRLLACTIWDAEADEAGRRAAGDDARVVDRDIRRAGLWVVAVPDEPAATTELPEARRLSPAGMHVVGAPSWAPDGARLVVAVSPSPRLHDTLTADLVAFSLRGESRRLARVEGLEAGPEFSPDGATIAFVAAEERVPALYALQTIPAAGGEPHVVAPGFEGSCYAFAWLPDGKRVVAGVETGQRHGFQVVDLETGTLTDAFAPFERPGSGARLLSVAPDGARAAFAWADGRSFGDIYAADLGGHPRRLTDLNPWVRDYDFGETREVRWAATDGLAIEGLLILSVGYEEGERYPLMVYIHGGPTSAWTHRLYAGWNDLAQFMAQRGYAVFLPNPRGSSGCGAAFARAIVGCYGEPDSADILSGVDHLVEQGIADPERLVVGGWSGGGFLTNWLITHTDRFKAAVSGAGVANWVSFQGTTDARSVFDCYLGSVTKDGTTYANTRTELALGLSPERGLSPRAPSGRFPRHSPLFCARIALLLPRLAARSRPDCSQHCSHSP